MSATVSTQPRELAYRRAVDLDVTLLWIEADSTVVLELADRAVQRSVRLAVDHRRALYAFHYPFAYAAEANVSADLLLFRQQPKGLRKGNS